MTKNDLTLGAKKIFYKSKFKIEKNSPEILLAAGVISVVGGFVLACRATLKVNEILAASQEDIEKIHACTENEDLADEYTADDSKKDLAIVYAQTALKCVKLYLPAVLIEVAGIGCILASNNVITKRHAALGAAYTAVDTSFKEYRKRVAERFGDEVEKEVRYNLKAQEIKEKITDPETGKEKTVKKSVKLSDGDSFSPYARCFEKGMTLAWDDNADYNLSFLLSQQAQANDRLHTYGYLFLNDVYDMLGFDRTKAGQIIGWAYKPDDSNYQNYVDFGIYNVNRRSSRNFLEGYEAAIWLDFNVDGNILDEI